MIVSQAEIDEIRSARIRRRVLVISVRYGAFGERKRCPLRNQQVVTLKPRIPYEQHKRRAETEPTRARAVLAFLSLCEARGHDVTITVRDVQLVDQSYIIRFEKGDLSATIDRPRLLAARPGGSEGDYTTVPARAIKGEGEAVPARMLERWATENWERHAEILADQRTRLLRAVQAVRVESARQNAGSFWARKRLKRTEQELKAQERRARLTA